MLCAAKHLRWVFALCAAALAMGLPAQAGAADQPVTGLEYEFDTAFDETLGFTPPTETEAGESVRWVTSRQATLDIPFPTVTDTLVSFRINGWISDPALYGLRLMIDEHEIALNRSEDDLRAIIFNGVIPAQVIAAYPQHTRLVFHVPETISPASLQLSSDTTRLAVQFDWLRLGTAPYTPLKDWLDQHHADVVHDGTELNFNTPIFGAVGWANQPIELSDGSMIQWTLERNTRIEMALSTERDLPIAISIRQSMSRDILDSLSVFVNGTPIDLTHYYQGEQGAIFVGMIPVQVLRKIPQRTFVEFRVRRMRSWADLKMGRDDTPRGVAFEWIRIGYPPFETVSEVLPPRRGTPQQGVLNRTANEMDRAFIWAGCGLLAVIVLGSWASGKLKAATAAPTLTPRAHWGWLIGALMVASVIIGTVVVVDPRNYYGINLFPPVVNPYMRDQKFQNYQTQDTPPDVLILGTSRSFTINPDDVTALTGYRAYNASVESGGTADYLSLLNFALATDPTHPPKVLLVEVSVNMYSSRDDNDRVPLWTLPYYPPDWVLQSLSTRFEGLLDLNQFSEAVAVLNRPTLNPSPWELKSNGHLVYHLELNEEQVNQFVARNLLAGGALGCTGIDPQGLAYFDALIALARENNISVVAFSTPYHPKYLAALTQGNDTFAKCRREIAEYMNTLSADYDQVFYSDLIDAGNMAAPELGFSDSHHISEANAREMIRRLASLIEQAAELAGERQAQSGSAQR